MPPHKFNSHIITILRIMGTLAEFMICCWLVAIYNLPTESFKCSLRCEFISEHFPTHDVGIPLMGSYPVPHRLNSFMEAHALLPLGLDLLCPLLSLVDPITCFLSLLPDFQRNNSNKIGKVKYRMASKNGISDNNCKTKSSVPDPTQNYSYWRIFIRYVN